MQFINTHNLLQNYINDNLNIFTTNILLNDKIVNSKENSVVITKLIFNPDIKDENKIHLIQKYDILIEDVSLVDNSLLTCLVLNSKIKLTWSNIQYIFDKLENKALLILFIQKMLMIYLTFPLKMIIENYYFI